jgi:hypothetical protein
VAAGPRTGRRRRQRRRRRRRPIQEPQAPVTVGCPCEPPPLSTRPPACQTSDADWGCAAVLPAAPRATATPPLAAAGPGTGACVASCTRFAAVADALWGEGLGRVADCRSRFRRGCQGLTLPCVPRQRAWRRRVRALLRALPSAFSLLLDAPRAPRRRAVLPCFGPSAGVRSRARAHPWPPPSLPAHTPFSWLLAPFSRARPLAVFGRL